MSAIDLKKIMLLLCIAAFSLAGCNPFAKKPKAQQGVLDLTTWNFDKQGMLDLDGEWEFYWKQLYTPADFRSNSSDSFTGYIEIPSDWNFQRVNGRRFSGQGYCTYRLKIKTEPGKLLGIRVPDCYSANALWVNGKLLASNGVVGKREGSEVPGLKPMIRTFKSESENELVLQVSNFFRYKGGANSSFTLGTADQMIRSRDVAVISSMFIVGMLLILLVYHLCIFALSRTDFIAVWFSLICLCVTMRNLVTNDRLITVLFPNLSPDIVARIEYESVFGCGVVFTIFIYSLFPKDFSRFVLKLIIAISILQILTIAVAPSRLYTSWMAIYQITTILPLIYCLVALIKAIRRKRPVAVNTLVVVCAVIAVAINDMLYARLIINTGYMISYAVPFLLVAQAYFIAFRIGSALKSVEKLSIELNDANQTLEEKVATRTAELEAERQKTEDLLLNILPAETAEELKSKGRTDARTYSLVSVMFIEMIGFEEMSKTIDPALLVEEIHFCFSEFDKIIEDYKVEKIKTIGVTYLCAAGLPVPNFTHTEDILTAAHEIRSFMNRRIAEQREVDGIVFEIRIGINTGPLAAGIVGTKKFAYDIWGDTVNTAARMEQNSEPGKINISGKTYELVKGAFQCHYRGKLEAKNKGMIDMYYAEKN